MRSSRLPITRRLRPAAAIFLVPFLIDWADRSLRLRSPLSHLTATVVAAGTIVVLLATAAVLGLRRRRAH